MLKFEHETLAVDEPDNTENANYDELLPPLNSALGYVELTN